MTETYTATAPGKVNLHLGVGEARADGYHDLTTVFQAVDLRETVQLRVDRDGHPDGAVVTQLHTTFHVRTPAEHLDSSSNLAWRAVEAVAAEARRRFGDDVMMPPVSIEVDKNIFVAGGMAGGSADAAAALVAANAFLDDQTGLSLDQDVLLDLARELGADVPFSLMGATALGTGRGDDLVEMMARGSYWWVFVNPGVALPTGEVFNHLDELRHNNPALVAHYDTTALAQALTTGDPRQVAHMLHNDLEPAAISLRPQLKAAIKAVAGYGMRTVVSGSGPTVAILCADEDDATACRTDIALAHPDYEVLVARGPVEGAALYR